MVAAAGDIIMVLIRSYRLGYGFFFSKKVELPDFSVLVVASKAGTAAGNW